VSAGLDAARDAIRARNSFLLTSHARPDGDSIGSQLAMAFALDALGKQVRIVNADPPPVHFGKHPGIDRVEVSTAVEGAYDALIVMECGDLKRPGVAGLDGYFTINIDHHVGNTGYGAINWFDESAAACTEMVFTLIERLGVPISNEIAAHIYLGILTDTGSFHHGSMSARTFEIARRCVEAGVDPAATAQQVFDSNSVGKLRLIGRILDGMQLEAGGRVAVLRLDQALLDATGSSLQDTEGLINMPLAAREIEAVLMLKQDGGAVSAGEEASAPGKGAEPATRVSLRSKGNVDVRGVAVKYGGGGHKNAAGLTLADTSAGAERTLIAQVVEAVQAASE
jgi:phosphoesterase RecJ-like protein